MRKRAKTFEWDDLRFFLAVIRGGTLSAAAQQLGVDHATVGRRVERLERVLNAKLFERARSGYEPTLAAERLLQTAEVVETAIVTGESEIADRDLSLAGVVRVGAPDGFGSMFLAPRLGRLCDAHPQLEVQLIATARLFSLSKREADIAITLTLPPKGRLVGRKLIDYRLGLYAATGYLAENGPIRHLDDLAGHNFIGYVEELIHTPELDYMPLVTDRNPVRLRSTNIIAQLQATMAGAGVTVLPAFMAEGLPGLVPVLPEDVRIYREFFLVMHEDSRSLARIREAANFIYQEVDRARDLFDPPAKAGAGP